MDHLATEPPVITDPPPGEAGASVGKSQHLYWPEDREKVERLTREIRDRQPPRDEGGGRRTS